MSGGALAALIAALGFVGLVAFVSLTLLRIQGILQSAQTLVKDIDRTAIPILEELRETVATVNVQLDRVDHVLAAAESISSTVSNVTSVVSTAVSNPLVKGVSALAGLRSSMRSLRKRKEK